MRRGCSRQPRAGPRSPWSGPPSRPGPWCSPPSASPIRRSRHHSLRQPLAVAPQRDDRERREGRGGDQDDHRRDHVRHRHADARPVRLLLLGRRSPAGRDAGLAAPRVVCAAALMDQGSRAPAQMLSADNQSTKSESERCHNRCGGTAHTPPGTTTRSRHAAPTQGFRAERKHQRLSTDV
jgi:hypothetical protein